MERMGECSKVGRVYKSGVEGYILRGRPQVEWGNMSG